MAIINPPAWMQNGTYDARTDRLMVAGLLDRGGPTSPADCAVTQALTPAMSVLVSAGTVYVDRAADANLGMYAVRNDGPVTVTIAAADSTNARIDIIIMRVYDAQYAGVLNTAALEVVTGTPSASPVAPSIPTASVELSRVTVGAGVTSIVNANIAITNRNNARLRASMAGGIAMVRTTTERAAAGAFATVDNPIYTYRKDATGGSELEYTINGTTWRTIRASGPSTVDTVAITGTYTGQPVSRKYLNKALSPDANGDTIIMTPGEYSGGGILTAVLHGSSTFDLGFTFRISSGNLLSRTLNSGGVPVTAGHGVTGFIDYWTS